MESLGILSESLSPLFRICFLLISPALSLIKFLVTLSYDRLPSVLPKRLAFSCFQASAGGFPVHGVCAHFPLSLHRLIVWVPAEASCVTRSLFWFHISVNGFGSSIVALLIDSSCSLVSSSTLLSIVWRQDLACADHRGISFVYLTDAQEILFLNEWVNVSLVLEIGVKTEVAW